MIREKIREADRLFELFNGVSHVTVALSGGADSMALLHALNELSQEYGFDLSAAHFNHCIRGEEAERDERFAEKYCKDNGIPFFAGRADVPSLAEKSGESIELAARRLRYEFLESVAEGVIATAHHAGDNFETVLFNLVRGTGLAGLCGIPPKRGRLIRPLLLCSREEIEEYCAQNSIPFVTDSTNLSDDYDRNRIRHRVIPELEAVRSTARNSVSRSSVLLREDEECLSALALEEYRSRYNGESLYVKDIGRLYKAIAKRVIRLYCEKYLRETDSLHINQIYAICLSGGRTSLPQGLEACVCQDRLIVKSAEKEPETSFEVKISDPMPVFLKENPKIHNLLLKNSIDCDKIVGKLVLRYREDGDSVRIYRRNGTKSLKKLYNEYRIPLCERAQLPVICDDEGIVWIARIGVAERCAVDESTKRIFRIDFTAVKGEV